MELEENQKGVDREGNKKEMDLEENKKGVELEIKKKTEWSWKRTKRNGAGREQNGSGT